jgi:hypothetical protein
MAIIVPYVKQTWTDGSGGATPVSAARLGVIEEGILDVSLAPAVSVFSSVNLTVVTATDTPLAFNSERFDQAGGAAATHHDNVTNNTRLTCLYAGIYLIEAMAVWSADPAGGHIALKLNNTTFIARAPSVTINLVGFTAVLSRTYALAVNDFVEVVARQDTGSNKTISTLGNYSPEFSMVRVA